MDFDVLLAPSRTDWRDWILIIAGILLIVLLVAWLFFTIVIGIAARLLLGTIRSVLSTEVSPLLGSMRQSVQSIQGTTAFISETAVAPVIRIYGIFAGLRRMVATLFGFVGRRRRKR